MTILLFTISPGLEIVGILPNGSTGLAYSADVTARGGLAPYQLSVLTTLPSGLTATDNGDGTLTISGTPTVEFSGLVTVQARDGVNRLVQREFKLNVIDAPVINSFLLLKTGSFLLLKTGDKLRLKNG